VTVSADRPAGTSASEPEQYDVWGPLPAPGVTVLEASAGTGKTFTIAALVTRFVAEGTPIGRVLAVTFTRMATGELRDRIRARMVSAEAGLSRHLEFGTPPSPTDSLVGLLATGSSNEVTSRRERLSAALTSFDEATITTTHGFCQLMLGGLGVAGDVATGATLLEDPSDVVEQVVGDLYVRFTLLHGDPPSFSRSEALRIAYEAVANPDTPLVLEPEGSPADLRRRFAERVRTELQRRLVDGNFLTFDDLLIRLRDTLRDPHRGLAACSRLRDRYSIVLVDEFQDTDPVQWEVVRTAFGSGQTRLVLIGDPKQAIYAFRGADVYAYLDAARLADRRFTLEENWRSDAPLLASFDALLDPVRLGHPDIPFRPVHAAPSHHRPGLVGAPIDAPFRVRLVTKDNHLSTTNTGGVRKEAATAFVAADLAAEVVSLLKSEAELVSYADDDSERSRRLLGPGDVAVLVGTNRQAQIVLDALRAVEVPAVVAGTESVFSTAAATEWLSLLESMEQPGNRARAVAVALTMFLGMSADQVAASGEPDWEHVHARLHRWSATLRQHGVASLFRTVLAGEGVPARLLREQDGVRRLTDLGHIARLLHLEASNAQHGPAALRTWLADRMEEAAARREGAEAEERSRWIDSDGDAVQVLTVHRSKGLEFPVVFCPYLWDAFSRRKGEPVVFHDADNGWLRMLDVAGGDGDASYDQHFATQRDEQRGESLRQLYVALTRAKHQVVCWWASVKDSNHSALGRLLLARDDQGNVTPSGPRRLPSDDQVRGRFAEIAERAPGLLSVEAATGPGDPPPRWSDRTARAVGPLDVAAFERSLDLRWRRTSYSGVTALVHVGPGVDSEPEEGGTTDEPLAGTPAELLDGDRAAAGPMMPVEESDLRGVVSPWSDLPGGVEMGTLVHRVLQETDFAVPDLDGEIARVIKSIGAPSAPEVLPDRLGAALRASLTTPLGPVAGDIALRDVALVDRLNEMWFELPVAGGDGPDDRGAVAMGDVAGLFEQYGDREPASPLSGYGRRLRDPLLTTDLRGYLTGSLDLVFRTRSGGVPRYFVVDYKTNWIGAEGEELSAWNYRPAALDTTMQRMHYPLQAIFYAVALHRYLRWRLPDYDPELNLGGVLYLFLRGMSGPGTPVVDGIPCGVFSWRPPARLVTELSDLFKGRA
jgi:exodeoxyribonuclease V beta subunit